MKTLSLRQIVAQSQPRTTYGRFGSVFLMASLVTGANWFIQSKLAEGENARANELIKRVNEKKTVSRKFMYNHSE